MQAESLLFDKSLDNPLAQKIITTLLDEGCEIVGDKQAQKLDTRIQPAKEDDWGMEIFG